VTLSTSFSIALLVLIVLAMFGMYLLGQRASSGGSGSGSATSTSSKDAASKGVDDAVVSNNKSVPAVSSEVCVSLSCTCKEVKGSEVNG
jgi:hypothetical protein